MANTFKNAVTGSSTSLGAFYTCPAATTAVVHAVYLSNVDGVNDETISLSVSGSANFNDRKYILKTVDVPADSTVVIEKPINLEANDILKVKASAAGDLQAFASVLEMT